MDRADITPRHPVPLAGYATRAELGPATDVSAPLRLRTLAFGAGRERAVLISADLLWWGTDIATRVRRDIAARYGLRPESVILHATHAHSGPQTSAGFTALLGDPDAGYVAELEAAAVASAGRALGSAVDVWMERVTCEAGIGTDRRSARSDGAVEPAPIDSDVTVVRFFDEQRTRALMVHHACHPVVHHGNVVTSDFTGAAMDRLEERHGDVLAVYLQGCCGDVNPDLYRDGVFRDGDQSLVDEVGGRLAEAVEKALKGEPTTLTATSPAASQWTVELPVTDVPSVSDLRRAAPGDGLMGQWARLLLEEPQRLRPHVTVRLSRLHLADGLTLLGMSGEPVSAYGLMVRTISGGSVLPLGYTNGMTGYLVTARQLAEGGYEAAEAPYYFGMPGPLAPEAEEILRDALLDAIWPSRLS
nr:neutral/alkaline non-lysosomal ceramidase N-terminal domain-containing protein [Phytoactinopolyspora alkaliphila]